jgi:Concanavalin A-like lectin/glucanases superfamily
LENPLRLLSVSQPGTLSFPHDERTGYVHWLGKGVPNQHEWALRMYSADNTEVPSRANRTSFYLFNLSGGEGAGSYVQEAVRAGTWYHYVAVVNMRTDTIQWYKNGVLKDQDPFLQSEYHITPQSGTAPVRLGTRDFASYFKGALDNLYIYNRALSAAEVGQLCRDTTP